MLGLRHIWTMSEHFSADEKMEMLLYKISYVFASKVRGIVAVHAIFKHSPATAYDLSTKCAKLLQLWKSSYMGTRALIERSEFGARWEFNKSFLFDDVDHLMRISNDIAGIALALIEFERIFGEQLKSIVHIPDDVGDILSRVSASPSNLSALSILIAV